MVYHQFPTLAITVNFGGPFNSKFEFKESRATCLWVAAACSDHSFLLGHATASLLEASEWQELDWVNDATKSVRCLNQRSVSHCKLEQLVNLHLSSFYTLNTYHPGPLTGAHDITLLLTSLCCTVSDHSFPEAKLSSSASRGGDGGTQ